MPATPVKRFPIAMAKAQVIKWEQTGSPRNHHVTLPRWPLTEASHVGQPEPERQGHLAHCNLTEDMWLVDTLSVLMILDMPSHSFPGGASDKEPACQCRRCKRRGFHPWVGKIPWRRTWQPTPVFLPGESCGQRHLAGYSLWGCKELDRTEAT